MREFLALKLERFDGFLGQLVFFQGFFQVLFQSFMAGGGFRQLRGQLGLIVGGQRHELGAAPLEFNRLFCALSAKLLGDMFALIPCLLFTLFDLFAGGCRAAAVAGPVVGAAD